MAKKIKYNQVAIKHLETKYDLNPTYIRMCINGTKTTPQAFNIKAEYAKLSNSVIKATNTAVNKHDLTFKH